MPRITGRVVETPDGPEPLKVVLERDGKILAEQPVNSMRSAQELMDAVLPVVNEATERDK